MSSYSSNTDAVYCSRASANSIDIGTGGAGSAYLPALRPTRVTAVRLRMSQDVPGTGGVISFRIYPQWSGGDIVNLGDLTISPDWKAGDVVIVNLTDDERATLYPGNRILAYVVSRTDDACAMKITYDFYEFEDGPPITVTPDGTKPVPNNKNKAIRSGGQYFTPATGMADLRSGFADEGVPEQIEEEDFFLNFPPKEEPAPATRSTKKTKTKKAKADDGC